MNKEFVRKRLETIIEEQLNSAKHNRATAYGYDEVTRADYVLDAVNDFVDALYREVVYLLED